MLQKPRTLPPPQEGLRVSMAPAPQQRSARVSATGEKMAMVTKTTDWPEPMKVLDQPWEYAHSSVMIETDWRADMTMHSAAKQSHTATHGLIRDLASMAYDSRPQASRRENRALAQLLSNAHSKIFLRPKLSLREKSSHDSGWQGAVASRASFQWRDRAR
jgi:hypothetical protein